MLVEDVLGVDLNVAGLEQAPRSSASASTAVTIPLHRERHEKLRRAFDMRSEVRGLGWDSTVQR